MNSDYEKKVSIESDELDWKEYTPSNSYIKLFSKKDEEATSIIKIEKNSYLSKEDLVNSVEIFVLDGIYTNEFGSFEKGTYLKLPKENEKYINSENGCIIFRKTNYKHTDEKIVIDTNKSAWLQGHGNLSVISLAEQTALVKWPKGEVFIPHRHWGGEEILVLSGTFIDEHGFFPKGTWIRSPHLSEHYPRVEEETIIFVKTGHL